MNTDALARELQSKISKWVALMCEIHLPDIFPRVMEAMEGGWYAEARHLLERSDASIVQDHYRPYWRGFEVKGKIVAEQEFARFEVCGDVGVHQLAGVWRTDDERRLLSNAIARQESQPGHIDEMVHEMDRDFHRQRRREIGRLWVKYGQVKINKD